VKEKIVIFGGTGFLGRRLIEKLKSDYEIIIASRNPNNQNSISDIKYYTFKYDVDSFKEIIDNSQIVINFSGASIAGRRWNEEYKKIMYDSRIKTTSLISEAISNCIVKPHTLISTSATGIYGNQGNEILTESSSLGNDYLSKMCIDWENAAFKSQLANVRTVCIRIGVVLDKNEGGFTKMMQPFKFFVGGKLGTGNQYLPWIHIEDIVNIFAECVKNKNLSSIVNGTAPNPVTNKEFSSTLAKVIKRPNLFTVPKFALKIILGEFADFLVSSQRVIPKKLIDSGFIFKFSTLIESLENILAIND